MIGINRLLAFMPLYYLASGERDGCGTRSSSKEKSRYNTDKNKKHQHASGPPFEV